MKSLFIFGFLILFSGCSSFHPQPEVPVENEPASQSPIKKIPKKRALKPTTGAIWELLNRDKLTLYFKSVDTGANLTVILEKGITQKSVPAGHWELTGFVNAGKTYNSMNTSKKFIFRMRKGTNTYAGSIVIGCPKISAQDFQYLKGMKFFNRYPFTSNYGLCEVVIGNDFAEVKNALRKSRKNKNLDFVIGF